MRADEDELSGVAALSGSGTQEESPLRVMLAEMIVHITRLKLELRDADASDFRVCSERLQELKALTAALPEKARERTGLGFSVPRKSRKRAPVSR